MTTKKAMNAVTIMAAAVMTDAQKLWILFKTTFLISSTTNTGYAILSVMKANFVKKYHWFTEEQMADYIALAQSAPGPMAINASMIIGQETCGMAGSFAAVLGCALPPFLVMLAVTYFYHMIIGNTLVSLFMKGMQYGVAAMLLDVLIGLFRNVTKKETVYPVVLIVLAFLYVRLANRSVFFLALSCVLIGLAKSWLLKRQTKEGTCC